MKETHKHKYVLKKSIYENGHEFNIYKCTVSGCHKEMKVRVPGR